MYLLKGIPLQVFTYLVMLLYGCEVFILIDKPKINITEYE